MEKTASESRVNIFCFIIHPDIKMHTEEIFMKLLITSLVFLLLSLSVNSAPLSRIIGNTNTFSAKITIESMIQQRTLMIRFVPITGL